MRVLVLVVIGSLLACGHSSPPPAPVTRPAPAPTSTPDSLAAVEYATRQEAPPAELIDAVRP